MIFDIIFAIFVAFNIIFFIYRFIDNIHTNISRESAEKNLKKYLINNKIKIELKNSYCEMRFIDNLFYCKERTNGYKQGRMFYVSGDKEHTMTTWGLINAEFNSKTTYDKIKKFYLTVGKNDDIQTQEYDIYDFYTDNPLGMNNVYRYRRTNSYINESLLLPDFVLNEAQNEYCRLRLDTLNEHTVVVCEEIWGKRYFIIESEDPIAILTKFKLSEYKMENYSTLLKKYKYDGGCNVILPGQKSEQKTYHATQKKQEQIQIQKQQTKEIPETKKPKKIDKTDERNVDL